MESKENAFKNNIQIKNFGPIKEADIEIAPLTVFVGPNSSGKSFAAKLIDILFNSYHIIHNYDIEKEPKYLFDFTQISLNSFRESYEEIYQEFSNLLWDYFQSCPSFDSEPLIIPSKIICSILNDGVLKEYVKFTEYSLKDTFWHDLNKLIRYSQEEFELIFNRIHFKYGASGLELNDFYSFGDIFNKLNNDDTILLDFDENNNLLVNISYIMLSKHFKTEDIFTNFMYSLIGGTIYDILSFERCFYIPADRNMGEDFQAHISNLVNNKNVSNYDKELTNNLLSIDYDKKGDFYELGYRFENEIFGGSVHFENSDDQLKESISKNIFALPAPLLSTSIQQLLVLIVHLKYLVNKGDTLIIEEPEAHIHPANQRIIVRYLVEAVNAGLKIIFTTHSDFMVDQLNNFIRLCDASPEAFEKLKLSKENILNYKDINIYHFKECDDEKYTFVPELIDINRTGFNEENFSKVIDELYDESDLIIDSSRR